MANELKVSKGLIVAGSGSVIASIQGSIGQLFSVTDTNIGSTFTVKDPNSGLSILEMYPGIVANNTILSSSLNVVIPQTNSSSFYGAAISSTGNTFRIIPGTGNNLTLAFNNTGVTTIKHSTVGGGSYTNPGTGESSSIQLHSQYMNLSTSDSGFGNININAALSASITAVSTIISSSSPVRISSILNLTSVSSLPAGNIGDMAVSASNLYFYSGSSWRKVSLV